MACGRVVAMLFGLLTVKAAVGACQRLRPQYRGQGALETSIFRLSRVQVAPGKAGAKIEAKEDIIKRIGRSSDKGDSFAYGYAIEYKSFTPEMLAPIRARMFGG